MLPRIAERVMTDDVASLILERLRRIDERVDRLATDMLEIKQRLGSLERRLDLSAAQAG